ncbi:helix-turn-helix transcriptional regulator [Salmonella enterica subsp. enterica serovar Newport]|uniref:Helix-turn-helix domain-containing protein n=4 Tax=Enterobacterales TaxID=91347 RepID=A0A5W3HV57_SALNE|nr:MULTISPECIES: helix-turn-helix transcriptional regulator [Enterobacteriaceae]EAA3803218.1 XRE family transcriptional regulator [Salmonella enterica subsp. enterica serovar Poona]EAA5686531.1 XRE family transcriptional regulator [Salmonella enterica subsp. enterica serovar Newport]EAA9397761.1 XRE family transcriptional regulator [Salmonella enterica subsp. enterica serovar 4,5,12:b:-]EBG5230090.1 helix-turn-helix transcriptional regulator [Salmonella enterica subsp. enterica serovar Concord]
MSRDYADKLRQIRKAEGMTQKVFSERTGLALGTIKSYEAGHQSARSEIVERVVSVLQFEKYTLWLMTNKTAPAAGQIAPSLSPDGQDGKNSSHSTQKVG